MERSAGHSAGSCAGTEKVSGLERLWGALGRCFCREAVGEGCPVAHEKSFDLTQGFS